MRALNPIATSAGIALICATALLTPACATRDLWQRPERVIDILEIAPGASVADIGAGDGYFIPYLARAVGPDGVVYAVDVDEEKVRVLEALVAEQELENVKVVLGGFDDPSLPDGEIDLVFMVNTYHHIEDRPAYFGNIRSTDLSSGGRVAVIEPTADGGFFIGLVAKEGHISSAPVVREEMNLAGYHTAVSHDFLMIQIFEVFTPKDL